MPDTQALKLNVWAEEQGVIRPNGNPIGQEIPEGGIVVGGADVPQNGNANVKQVLPHIEAYYDGARGNYWVRDNHGGWVSMNETGLKRFLKSRGISPQLVNGYLISPLDSALLEIQQSYNVAYAGPLAGYLEGFREILGGRVLVTSSPKLIEPAPGEWPVLKQLLSQMFTNGEFDQTVYFMGWLKFAITSLRSGQHRPGQAIVMAGPSDSAKSLVQKLTTEMLGGRMAKPFQYMLGITPFNADLFEAEHLVIEDEAASTDIRARRNFGAHLKEITVNDHQRCHAKNRQPVSLTAFWRLSITLNEEPENLMVLPPIDESIEDKIILLKVRKHPMPMPTNTLEERRRFWETLCGELPAFVHYLLEWEIPAELRSARFGIKHFHHPELLQALDDLAPESRLLSIIDGGGLFDDPADGPWEGTAEKLESRLLASFNGGIAHEVRRLFSFNTACGVYLARLARKHPARVTKRVLHGRTLWTVIPATMGGEVEAVS